MSAIGNKVILARNLQYYIERSGKDRGEIADELGIPYSTFTEWLNARKYPRIDKIEILAEYFGILKSDLIEEKLTPEKEKDNDTLANIIVRLRTDQMFRSVVESIYNMNPAQLESVDQMLKTLEAFRK